jgi:hypothetical protein
MKRLVLVAALLAGGCSSDLAAASFIDKLRVLAVRAEPPEIDPGQTAALDLLAVEPVVHQLDGGGVASPLTAVWLACPLPSGTLTVAPCGVGEGAPAPEILGGDLTASYTAPANLLAGQPSTEVLITVAVADTAAGAMACVADIANNNGLPTDPDHCVVSLKRVVVSDPAQRTVAVNANPTLASFYATTPSGFAETLDDDGGVWQYAPGEDLAAWDVAALRAGDAAQMKADGTYESLTVSWFTTAGHLDGGRSIYLPPGCDDPAACADQLPEDGADTTWFAPTQAQAAGFVDGNGLVRLWAVIRDDRGGVGWREGSLALTR